MRLLRLEDDGEFSLVQIVGRNTPRYAVLSHTWGADHEEVTFKDLLDGTGKGKPGYTKICSCGKQAAKDGLQFFWVDTCCIDKTSSAELSEAINSMYRWYQEADVCYAYLNDVPSKAQFSGSRWFTRGWTIQELIAPSNVNFFDNQWNDLGTKATLQDDLSKITRIPVNILSENDLETASVAQKMSWAAQRETTKVEDRAYCLMGIFGVNMPLLYGEGERAFIRLQEEIMRVSDDHSLFAWRCTDNRGGLLATSPAAFVNSDRIIPSNPFTPYNRPFTLSNKGIHLKLPFIGLGFRGLGLAVLHCTEIGKTDQLIGIYLRDMFLTLEHFERVQSEIFELLNLTEFGPSQYPVRKICVKRGCLARMQNLKDIGKNNVKSLKAGQNVGPEIHLQSNCKQCSGSGKGIPLLLRTANGGHEIIKQLVRGSDIETNLKDGDGLMSLSYAAREGHEAVVKLLLDRDDIQADPKDTKGRTPLSHAAGRGHGTIVMLLLARGDVEADTKDIDGRTPLLHAAAGGHEEVLWLLLSRSDVAVTSTDKDGRTLLSHAARGGHWAVVKLLLARSDIDAFLTDRTGRTALSHAAENGHEAIVKLLLGSGRVEPGLKDNIGRTPLSYAAHNGHEAVIKLLLGTGRAKPDLKDNVGRTPLVYATQNGHEAVINLVLEKGGQLESRENRYGQTLLSYAAGNGHEAVVKLLLGKGANLELKCNTGLTPLSYAAMNGHEAIVMLLVEKGANLESQDRYGQTPLLYAARNGRDSIVMLLLEKGADLEVKSNNGGWTPLLCAAENRHEAIVMLLIEKGANLESKDDSGQTPLLYAARSGHNAVVKLLLEKGANLESKDYDYGKTPLSWAADNGHKAVVKLLIEKGANPESKDYDFD